MHDGWDNHLKYLGGIKMGILFDLGIFNAEAEFRKKKSCEIVGGIFFFWIKQVFKC